MELNLLEEGEKEIEVWIPYNDAEILIVSITEDGFEKIRNRCQVNEFVNGQLARNLDLIKFAREIGKEAVKNWKNLTVNKKPFEFNGKNRDLAMTKDADFFTFVSQSCRNISFLREKQQKKTEDVSKKK